MRSLKTSWFPILLAILIAVFICIDVFKSKPVLSSSNNNKVFNENEFWRGPSEDEIPAGREGDEIRYGKQLITNTSVYFGPRGVISRISNGMNCQNCHLDAGTKLFANPFAAVNSTYPRYRERSGKTESIEFRINDCFERSLNGQKPDNNAPEMKAMVAYIKWVGKDVPKGYKPKGSGIEAITFLKRSADTVKGKQIYLGKCMRCHGGNGEGVVLPDSSAYTYPPLWKNSYNNGAGMYTLSKLAGFIKNNMPNGEANWQNPVLTSEEAWDVAAYVNSRPRPQKMFKADWPDISKKPFDYPFGPYKDSFTETQHKYGPFEPIIKRKGGGK